MDTFCAILIGICVGVFIGIHVCTTIYMKDMVKHGCGYYDATTGEFREKDAGGE
jgi:hypothetical protein